MLSRAAQQPGRLMCLVRTVCIPAHLQEVKHHLLRRRILMLSNDSSRVSAAVHAAAALLYPFRWHHIYLPLLPHCLQARPCPQLPWACVMQQVQLQISEPAGTSAPASGVVQQSTLLLMLPHRVQGNPLDRTELGAPQDCMLRCLARSLLPSCVATDLPDR